MNKQNLIPKATYQKWDSSMDYQNADKKHLVRILFNSLFINRFEHRLIKLQQNRQLWGPLHTSLGVEAIASAAISALEKKDRLTATHRGHHHFLAKSINYLAPSNWDPALDADYDFLNDLAIKTMAEILGLESGFCGGRGGSMHLYYPEAGVHGTNGIVGGGIPCAVGLAFASKYLNKNEVAVSFFGDGAINQGSFHESANLASIWQLPVLFFIENNQYAVGTKVEEVSSVERLSQRGLAYDMPSYTVEGTDLLAVYEVMKEATANARSGKGPSIIEVLCYRPVHHDTELPGSAYGYRSKEEEKLWASKDPLEVYISQVVELNIISQSDLDAMKQKIDQVLDFAEGELTVDGVIKENLWPDPATVAQGIRSDGNEFNGIEFREPSIETEETTLRYSQVIAKSTGRWLESDSAVVEWGEDIANFRHGPYGATENLMNEFPGRILNTPISENGFVGMALGAAMNGVKPIVEIMFPDFSLVAADQLFNQIGKARHMYGGDLDLPIVVRTRVATGTGMGPQHSMDPTALFALFSGWRIIAPSNAVDYIGLFNSAMRSKDPVLIIEHQALYAERMPIPSSEEWNYYIPFGKAKIIRKGADLTVVAYGGTILKVTEALKAKELEHLDVEVIDLRSLDFSSIDYTTIIESVRRTGHLLVIEESIKSQGIGAEICSEVSAGAFEALKSSPNRLTSIDVPISVSRVLENAAILQQEDIISYLHSENWKKGD